MESKNDQQLYQNLSRPLQTGFSQRVNNICYFNLIVCCKIDYSRKNPNRGVQDIFFFENPAGIFHFSYFTSGNSRQKKAQQASTYEK